MNKKTNYASGQRLSASDINNLSGEINRQSRITATPPIILSTSPNGVQIGYQEPGMWAIVTYPFTPCGSSSSASSSTSSSAGPGNKKYKVREAHQEPEGEYTVMQDGRCGYGYEANNNDVPSGSVVWCRPGKSENEWSFVYGGGGGSDGGGFPAWITASYLEGGNVVYEIAETEIDPVTKLTVEMDGGRTGPAYRHSTEEIDPPPIPVGQSVWAIESLTVPGSYEITPWGGMYRTSKRHMVKVEGTLVPNPEDCTTSIIGILCYFQNERLSAREICGTYSPIGETPEGGT